MKSPAKPNDEAQRLQALQRLNILDTGAEERFDRITRQAQLEFQVPIALVCFVDKDRQWFKSRRGIQSTETPRDISFCGHAIQDDDLFVIENAVEDSRFSDNPLVVDDPHIRFYAGCPIRSPDGYNIGTLCVIDRQPRAFTEDAKTRLRRLALRVEQELASPERKAKELPFQGKRRLVRTISSRLGAGVLAGLLLLSLLFAVSQSVANYRDSIRLGREKVAVSELAIVRANIESYVNAKVFLVHGLTGLVQLTDSITQAQFEQFAEQLGGNIPGVTSLQLAPAGIVKYVWPIAGNRKAIGHDLLGDPGRRAAAERAIEARAIWLAGPLELLQGGQAIIARAPIFKRSGEHEAFWGFATLLLDTDVLLARSIPQALLIEYDLALRGVDGLGERGQAFWGDSTLFSQSPLLDSISLPAGSWQVAIRPKSGWEPAPGALQLRGAIGSFGAAIVSFLFYLLLRIPARLRSAVIEATSSLERSETRFRDAVEALPDGFVVFDRDGRLALANSNFQHVLDRTGRDFNIGGSFEDMLQEGVARNVIKVPDGCSPDQFMSQRLDDFWSVSSRNEIQLVDGQTLDVIFCSMADGGRVGFFRDITAEKANKTQLEAEKQRAEAASQSKTEFLATMSHEVRTPLNGVLGLLGMLSADASLSEDQFSMISTANESATHLLQILNEILDISKIESGTLELDTTPFDLGTLIASTTELLRAEIDRKELKCIAEIDPLLSRTVLEGDEGRLRQVILNLLSNAVKFTKEGEIRVLAQCIDDSEDALTFSVSIRDTGIGFSDADADRLFEPFSQLDSSSSRQYSGTGLGLAICKHLLEIMGGTITAKGAPDVGADFTMVLKLNRCKTGNKVDDAPQLVSTPNELGWPTKRVLLVEDGPTNQIVVQAMLKDTGYLVDIAQNGREAILAVKSFPYDIVLMDIYMPEMDGVEATQHIRGYTADLPIVALTANAMPGDRERFIAAGMNDYLAKPVNRNALIGMLYKHLSPKVA